MIKLKCGRTSESLELLTPEGKNLVEDLSIKKLQIEMLPQELVEIKITCYAEEIEVLELEPEQILLTPFKGVENDK